jgi:hypothetical protein
VAPWPGLYMTWPGSYLTARAVSRLAKTTACWICGCCMVTCARAPSNEADSLLAACLGHPVVACQSHGQVFSTTLLRMTLIPHYCLWVCLCVWHHAVAWLQGLLATFEGVWRPLPGFKRAKFSSRKEGIQGTFLEVPQGLPQGGGVSLPRFLQLAAAVW